MRLKRVFISTAAAGLAVSGAVAISPAQASPASTATPAAASTIPTPPTIGWGTCTSSSLKALHAQCGYVTVPMDYSNPSGQKIKLAVSRVRHTVSANKYQGVLLVNPGGPGGSGLTDSALTQYVPKHAGDAYDWIGFDPRGVGDSKPSLSCDPNYFSYNRPDYTPTTKALENVWLSRSKHYAQACAKDAPALLNHIKTIDSAKDMESIRKALGADQINYLGFSYGTYLGQVYGTLFPNKIRRMVLDSSVDPRGVWYQANLDQDVAFDRNINIWFGWLAKYDDVYHLGKTTKAVRDLWYAQKAKLDAKPAGGIIGSDEWTDLFLNAGYYQITWTELGSAFAGWIHQGDYKTLKAEYDAADGLGDDNGFAVYNAVQCSDVQWPKDYATWRRDNTAIAKKAPFETWANAWFNAPCLFWPAKSGTPVKIDGSKVAPALLIDETLDAATPYEGSLEVRRLFPKSSLIAEPGGTTHAGTLYGNACVDNKIADYLISGDLPERRSGDNTADTYCKPLPQPVPMSGDSASAASKQASPNLAPQVTKRIQTLTSVR